MSKTKPKLIKAPDIEPIEKEVEEVTSEDEASVILVPTPDTVSSEPTVEESGSLLEYLRDPELRGETAAEFGEQVANHYVLSCAGVIPWMPSTFILEGIDFVFSRGMEGIHARVSEGEKEHDRFCDQMQSLTARVAVAQRNKEIAEADVQKQKAAIERVEKVKETAKPGEDGLMPSYITPDVQQAIASLPQAKQTLKDMEGEIYRLESHLKEAQSAVDSFAQYERPTHVYLDKLFPYIVK